MKTIVVGAGIVGASLAYSLLNRGHEVALIEAEGVAAGTTSTSYAWINSHKKHPESYHALNYQGLKHWTHVVASEHPGTIEINGHVEFAVDADHRATLTRRVLRLQSLDYAAKWITSNEAAQLTPAQIPGDALIGFFPWEGHSYPHLLTQARVDEMRQNPKFSLVMDQVVSISRAEGKVELRSGPDMKGDVVVLAVGNATTELASTAGIALPMIPRKVGGAAFGYLAYVQASGHGVRGPITCDHLNLRPNGNDQLIVQALDLDATADPNEQPAMEIEEEFLRRLQVVLPSLHAQLEKVRVGVRVIPGDGLTVAGPAADEPDNRLWIAVTHSGVVLGPWLGEALAEEISTGRPTPLLKDFRPLRFTANQDISDYSAPRKPGDQ